MHVLVVSSHHLFGQSLVTMLQSLPEDNPIEATLCDVSAVASRVRTWAVSVILLEAAFDFASALASVQDMASVLPGTGVVVLGPEEDRAMAYAAIMAGAEGYVAADAPGGTLSRTLHEVAQGNIGLPKQVTHHVLRKLRQDIRAVANSRAHAAESLLTPQQREILFSVQQGDRTRVITERLGISEATVVKHLQHLAETLQTRNSHTI
jgi:DNA-binding NarL/FixJ family response regulator